MAYRERCKLKLEKLYKLTKEPVFFFNRRYNAWWVLACKGKAVPTKKPV